MKNLVTNLKEKLKMEIDDQKAAFIILGFVAVTIAVSVCINMFARYNKVEATNGGGIALGQEAMANILVNGLPSEANTNTIDEEKLQKENEEEFEKLKKENKVSSAIDKYYIKVNYGAQVVNIYKKNSNGKYEPYKAMVCSTGTHTPPSGVYRTLGKGNWWGLMGNVYGQYSTHIMGDILFHSVPYLEKGDKSSLEYWAYDQLGQRVSMGCVRLTVKDAKWIYENCPIGTQVEFYSSSNPGPLGKPTTRKISDAPANVRGWDPTDPDSKNPWPAYLKKQEEKKKDNDKKDSNKTNQKDEDKKDEPQKDNKPSSSEKPNDDDKDNNSNVNTPSTNIITNVIGGGEQTTNTDVNITIAD